MGVQRSNELYAKAKALIPGGTQTASKRPESFVPDRWPAYWDRAQDAHIWDLDGNEYVDYVMALGPIVLGYAHPKVKEAIARQLEKGSVTSLQSPLEVAVAEKLVEHVPCAEMVRFMKSGAEATAMAVRIARGYTNREKVVSCGYAGWHDWWVAKASSPNSRGSIPQGGVPEVLKSLAFDLAYGDVSRLEALAAEHGDDVACIMIDTSEVNDNGHFLGRAREMAGRMGAVLVFDEIITGFRMGLSGAQGVYGVTPDMATFGKAIANGMPLSATVGRRDIMETATRLWITSTFGGEALSLAAALATIEELEKPETLERLHRASQALDKGFREIAARHGSVEVFGQLSMPGIRFTHGAGPNEEAAREYVARMLEAGFLTRPNYVFFVTASLTEQDIERTLEATEQAVAALDAALV
jgi:glutamate-1-semialdehyde-2,1-aminomutase